MTEKTSTPAILDAGIHTFVNSPHVTKIYFYKRVLFPRRAMYYKQVIQNPDCDKHSSKGEQIAYWSEQEKRVDIHCQDYTLRLSITLSLPPPLDRKG